MTNMRKAPAAVATRGASQVVKLAGFNDLDHSELALFRQLRSIARRVNVSPALANVLAEHAFGGAGR